MRDRFSIGIKSKTVALDVCEYMFDCMGESASKYSSKRVATVKIVPNC
jgi:hypothetical protein